MQKIQYILTKDGLEQKMQLMQHFLRKKEEEYNQLRQEWEELTAKAEQLV